MHRLSKRFEDGNSALMYSRYGTLIGGAIRARLRGYCGEDRAVPAESSGRARRALSGVTLRMVIHERGEYFDSL